MANVLKLLSDAPDSEVIRELEEKLEQARSGELRSIVYCGELSGGRCFSGKQGDLSDTTKVVFELEWLKWRLIKAFDEHTDGQASE